MFANQSILEDRNAFVFQMEKNRLRLLNPHKEQMPDQEECATRGLSSRRGSTAKSKSLTASEWSKVSKKPMSGY